MRLDNLLATLEKRDVVTPVTPVTLGDVTAKPAWLKACTPVTPVTSQNDITANIEPLEPSETPKPDTLLDKQREARRQKVIAMLNAAPGTQRAIYADTDSDPYNVILAVAVRACMQTCELLIPKAKYDAWRLLELIERHGATIH